MKMSLTSTISAFVILTVIDIFLILGTNASVEVIKETRSFPNKGIIYSQYNSFEDGRLLYVVCDSDNHSKCKIVQEKTLLENSTRSCDIDLPIKSNKKFDDEKLDENFAVVAFGKNRVILFWDNKKEYKPDVPPSATDGLSDVKFTIVNLDDCKKTNDFKLIDVLPTFDQVPERMVAQLSFLKKVVTYSDSFEIFFRNNIFSFVRNIPPLFSPKDYSEYKVTINSEGKAINGPVVFLNDSFHTVDEIYSISKDSPSKGYVYSKHHIQNTGYQLSLTHPDGTEKLLGSYESFKEWNDFLKMSVVNENIGVCRHSNKRSNITCTQYNSDGDLLFTFPFNYSDNVRLASIYTLPQKGFILQFIEYENCQGPLIDFEDSGKSCSGKVGSLLVKVNTDGKPVGKLSSQELNAYTTDGVRHIWKNQETDRYCSLFASKPKYYMPKIDIVGHCFTDEDLHL